MKRRILIAGLILALPFGAAWYFYRTVQWEWNRKRRWFE